MTGCSMKMTVNGKDITNPPEEPAVSIEDIAYEGETFHDDVLGDMLRYTIINNSNYTLKTYTCYGTNKDGSEELSIGYTNTLLAKEKSPIQEDYSISNLEDLKPTMYSYEYIDEEDRTVLVDYDVKLEKYSVGYVIE